MGDKSHGKTLLKTVIGGGKDPRRTRNPGDVLRLDRDYAGRGALLSSKYEGFPKIKNTFSGVLRRTIVFCGSVVLYWGPLILGNYHIRTYFDRLTGPGDLNPGSPSATNHTEQPLSPKPES